MLTSIGGAGLCQPVQGLLTCMHSRIVLCQYGTNLLPNHVMGLSKQRGGILSHHLAFYSTLPFCFILLLLKCGRIFHFLEEIFISNTTACHFSQLFFSPELFWTFLVLDCGIYSVLELDHHIWDFVLRGLLFWIKWIIDIDFYLDAFRVQILTI